MSLPLISLTTATLPPCTYPPTVLSCTVAIPSTALTLPLILLLTITFGILIYLLELYLDIRQRSTFLSPTPPDKLYSIAAGLIGKDGKTFRDKDGKTLAESLKEKFQSSQDYGYDKINFNIVNTTVDIFVTLAGFAYGVMPKLYQTSIAICSKYGYTEENEKIVSITFFLLLTLLGELQSLPASLYSTFYIEKKHGFNKTTVGLYITDKVKSLVLTAAIASPLLSLLIHIIKTTGPYFYVYAYILILLFTLFMLTVYPVVIMPMFNKYDPLPDGQLKDKIYALAASIQYPLTKLFVVDGSKRSSHSNAYMYGFGRNKRIVLFDTLVDQVDEDEILSILGHELGHWKLSHTVTNFIFTQAYMGSAFFVFGVFYNEAYLYDAFGFDGSNTYTLIKLLLFFSTVWSPVDKVLTFIMTLKTRMCEFQADAYAIGLGLKSLQSGLTKISLKNLGAMKSDWMYATYHYSHPPLVERLVRMEEEQKMFEEKNGGTKKKK
jgi:STE24 endopeptidase